MNESLQKTAPKEFIEQNKDRFLNELIELLKIPSVSADSKFKADVLRAADYLRAQFEKLGVDHVEVAPTAGYPIVYAEKIIDAALPTVLVYGHYDVQPADPYELWDTEPFDPQIREGKIYARGACDDKGQMYMHLKAFETLQQTGDIPCNIKFMIEGEEEVGSDNLELFVKANKEKLAADMVLISDTSIISLESPSITVGLRGMSYVEVEVTGPNRDLHSGVYGGAVGNPINILCQMIGSLHDENGKITVKGFYDKVLELTTEERSKMAEAPFDEAEYKRDLEVDGLFGEPEYSVIERTGIRPTLDVNGIWGGYTGEGSKTVLPSKAYAKVSMRLVPDQDPKEITQLFLDHFNALAPESVKVTVTPHHGAEPAVTPIDSTSFKAATAAYQEVWDKTPIPTRDGGSIPIVKLFENELGLQSLLLGFGLDSDLIHSPNEHYGIDNYFLGIETIVAFYKHYAKMSS